MASSWSFLWLAPWFKTLSPGAKLVYWYVATNPRTSPLGLLFATPQSIATDLGVPAASVEKHLAALADEVAVDGARGLLWVARHVAVVRPRVPGDVKSWSADLAGCTAPALRERAAVAAGRVALQLTDAMFSLVPEEVNRVLGDAVIRDRSVADDVDPLGLRPPPDKTPPVPTGGNAKDKDQKSPKIKKSNIDLRSRITGSADARARVAGRRVPWRRLPPSEELTPDRKAWAEKYVAAAGVAVDVEQEWEKLKDHQFKDGKLDADACWRTWIRNACEWSRREGGPRPGPKSRRGPRFYGKGDDL